MAWFRTKPFTRSSTAGFSGSGSRVARRHRRPRSNHSTWFGISGGPLIGTRTSQRCRRSTARWAEAQRVSPARHVSSGSGAARSSGEGRVDHVREQLVLRRDVAIEGHRRRAQLARHAAHRHGGEAVRDGDAKPGLDDRRQAQAGTASPRPRLPSVPRRRDAARDVLAHRTAASLLDSTAKAYIIRIYAYAIRSGPSMDDRPAPAGGDCLRCLLPAAVPDVRPGAVARPGRRRRSRLLPAAGRPRGLRVDRPPHRVSADLAVAPDALPRRPSAHRPASTCSPGCCRPARSASSIGALSPFGPVIRASNVVLALVWLTVTITGYRAGRQYRLADHRRWMIRSVVLTLSIITNRVWAVVWVLALVPQLQTTFGGNEALMVQSIAGLSGWLGWVLPLLVTEWWLDTPAGARIAEPRARSPDRRRRAVEPDESRAKLPAWRRRAATPQPRPAPRRRSTCPRSTPASCWRRRR